MPDAAILVRGRIWELIGMEERRRAELMLVNVRWLVLLLTAVGFSGMKQAPIPHVIAAAVVLYNGIATLLCMSPTLYSRTHALVTYGTRACDLAAITAALYFFWPDSRYLYFAYVFVVIGTAIVLPSPWSLGVAAAAALAQAAATYPLAEPDGMYAWGRHAAVLMVVLLVVADLGGFLSRYYRRSDAQSRSVARLRVLQRLAETSASDHLLSFVQLVGELALDYTGAAKCTATLWGAEVPAVAVTVEGSGGGKTARPERINESGPEDEPGGVMLVTSVPVVEPFTKGKDLGFTLRARVKVRDNPANLDIVAHGLRQPVTEDDISAMTIFANQVGIVLEQTHAAASLRQAAQTDAVTGLLNKRALMTRVIEVVGQSRVANKPVAVLMLDLDGFKNYNDIHGHLAGDTVLEQVGSVLRNHTRERDVAGRFGGDEFVLVLNECDVVAASEAARRILSDIENAVRAKDKGDWPQVTASCGISVMPDDGTTVDALIKAADTCLLQAKQLGKSRLFVSGLSLDKDWFRQR